MEYTTGRRMLIASVFKALLTWFVERRAARPFVYLDLHAGSGMISAGKGRAVPGSPISFLQAAKDVDVQTLSVLFEYDKHAYDELLVNTGEWWSQQNVVIPVMQDSRTGVKQAVRYAKDSTGVTFCDPCEVSISFEALTQAITKNSSLDILLHCNIADYRVRRQLQKLRDGIEDFNKRYWFISAPNIADSNWSLFYGTSHPKWGAFAELEELKMAYRGTPIGEHYFKRALAGKTAMELATTFKPHTVKCPPSLHRDKRGRVVCDAGLTKFVADHPELGANALASMISCHPTTIYRVRRRYKLPCRAD